MKKIILLACMFLALKMSAQDFSIGYRSMEFLDRGRANRKIPVKIYYPADSTGENKDFPSVSQDGFPLVIFTHGYLSRIKSYENIRKMLVPRGYILVFPETGGGLFPSHKTIAEDIFFLSLYFPSLSDNKNSFFHHRIDTSLILMGHSMGGGCSYLAAESLSNVDGIISLAAYETNPSARKAASNIYAPSLLLGGSRDPITPPENHQIPIYKSLAGRNKTFINILGGSHCQMSDQHKSCKLSELLLMRSPGISRKEQHDIIEKYILKWLEFILRGDEKAGKEFVKMLLKDRNIQYKHNNASD